MKIEEKVILEPQVFRSIETYGDDEEKVIKIQGRAIKAGVPTRNGICYSQPSLQRYCNFFTENKKTIPSLDTHNDESIRRNPPFGKIEKLWMEGDNLMYQMDVDPREEMFIHKVKRGDIKEVSIQAIVDAVNEREDMNTGDMIIDADVRELLEISPVLIPGSRDSNMQFLEQQGMRNVTQENLHLYERKFGLAVTEKRLREKFVKKVYKESGGLEEPIAYGDATDKDEDEKNLQLQKPNKEDINTANSDDLYDKKLSDKVKPAPEPFLSKQVLRSSLLRATTKRF